MTTLRSWALASALAGTACGNLYGVGELSAGTDGAAGKNTAPADTTTITSPTSTITPSPPANAGSGGIPSNAGSGGTPSNGGNAGSGGTPSSGGSGGSGSANGNNQPPSCRDLPATCGTSPTRSRDCCTSLEIAGGSFFRSYDKVSGAGWDNPSSPANIATFRLDAYEVTVGRFRRFVAAYPWQPPKAAGKNPANPSDSGWSEEWNALLPPNADALSGALRACGSINNAEPSANNAEPSPSTWTTMADTNEALPINCLTWFEAFAFCAWDGGRLPSEAEWNYAAAGGSQARVYPWASSLLTDIDPSHAVYDVPIAPVGSKALGDGLFGQADLAGNVWEWNLDWFRAPYRVPCDNCAEFARDADTGGRVLRGGGYYNQTQYLRSAERGNAVPTIRDPGYGVRCARAD